MYMPTDRKLRSRLGGSDATLMMGWGGVGVGHVNVRVNLLKFLMLRWWWGGVGWGMLTFVWTCWGSWCYADDGVGWGMLTFVWTCWSSWCYADDGVGWGGACYSLCELAEVLDATLMMGWGGVRFLMLQKLGESHGFQTARDVKMMVRTAEHAWTCLKQKLRFALAKYTFIFKNTKFRRLNFRVFVIAELCFRLGETMIFEKNSTSRPHFPVRRDVYVYVYVDVDVDVYICIYAMYVLEIPYTLDRSRIWESRRQAVILFTPRGIPMKRCGYEIQQVDRMFVLLEDFLNVGYNDLTWINVSWL